jgi:hypothetical protein
VDSRGTIEAATEGANKEELRSRGIMDKRYHVFVSSTYEDLKEEREELIRVLLRLDCFPSGMELFPATDEDVWNLIKRVIDDCDCYMVILGGTYGSRVRPGGMSYTRKEYEYAVSKEKPILAFLRDPPFPKTKRAQSRKDIKDLERFRSLLKRGRNCAHWRTSADLAGCVAVYLRRFIEESPAIGWVRAESQLVKPLRETEPSLLQVLLTDFALTRTEHGSRLRIRYDDQTKAISLKMAKPYVQSGIPDFEKTWKELQDKLDDFLLERKLKRLQLSHLLRGRHFPFRYGNGGVLPVLRMGRKDYYCLFYRDSHPIGWNIANGGTDSRAELLDPITSAYRELLEELLIFDLENGLQYVVPNDPPNSAEPPEFSAARRLWSEFIDNDLTEFKAVWARVVWTKGTDQLELSDGWEKRVISPCYVNITANDFGIEVDRVVRIKVPERAALCDGEIVLNQLLKRVIGLFEVPRMNSLIRNTTSFLPDRVFHNGKQVYPLKATDEESRRQTLEKTLENAIDDYLTHIENVGLRKVETGRESPANHPRNLPSDVRYGLCPVTRRIIRRYSESNFKPSRPL